MPTPIPLPAAVAGADVVVVGEVSRYTPDAEAVAAAAARAKQSQAMVAIGPLALADATRLQFPGRYLVRAITTLKGKAPSSLAVDVPEILSINYGGAAVHPAVGSELLLCLKRSGDHWTPVDSAAPVILLAEAGTPPAAMAKTAAAARGQSLGGEVLRLVVASLANPTLRKANLFLVRDTRDPFLARAVRPYAHDPDVRTRDYALYCLAVNGVADVVPIIGALEETQEAKGSGTTSVTALADMANPEAVPYLAAMLQSPARYARLNASFALRNLADRSVAPFLFLGLRDPDPDVAYNCYFALHRILGTVGRVVPRAVFVGDREPLLTPLYDWWTDELAGKHVVAGDPVAVRARQQTAADGPRVLALYYGWFGTLQRSQSWQHYGAVDAAARTIAGQAHYPVGGPYDSTDPAVLQRQVKQVKDAGIDTLVCSWWGKDDQTDKAFRALLPVAAAQGLTVCPMYERNPRPGNADTVRDEWNYLLSEYAQSSAFLKVGGKPVIFVYDNARSELSNPQWAQILLDLEKQSAPGVAAIADTDDPAAASVFDGLFLLDPSRMDSVGGVDKLAGSYDAVYRSLLTAASRARRIPVLTVTPGHQDAGADTADPSSAASLDAAERGSGRYYSQQWQAATEIERSHPESWILVNSFNQWQAGSEIEPSSQFGDEYVGLTQEYATRLKMTAGSPAR